MKGLLLTAALALGTTLGLAVEIRCRFIILARKGEPTPDYADTGLRTLETGA